MPASESALQTRASSWSSRPEKASSKCGRLVATATRPTIPSMAAPTSTTIARVPALVFFRLARSLSRRSFMPGLDVHAHDLAVRVDQLVADLHRELERELGV